MPPTINNGKAMYISPPTTIPINITGKKITVQSNFIIPQDAFNPNIKIFKKNDAFIEINISDFINKCKKYLIEVLDYGITSIEDKDNIKLSISKGGLIVQDFSSSGSYEQSIIDALQWHLNSLKDIKKGA